MSVLIEKVDDDLYVNVLAVEYVKVEKVTATQGKVAVHFTSGEVINGDIVALDVARERAANWQRLLNSGKRGDS